MRAKKFLTIEQNGKKLSFIARKDGDKINIILSYKDRLNGVRISKVLR